MDIKLSQQVSATFARNNFKAVNDRVIKEGMCVIVRKSTPVTVMLSLEEYQKLQNPKSLQRTKLPLSEIRKASSFTKFRGCIKEGSVKLAKKWTDYVD